MRISLLVAASTSRQVIYAWENVVGAEATLAEPNDEFRTIAVEVDAADYAGCDGKMVVV